MSPLLNHCRNDGQAALEPELAGGTVAEHLPALGNETDLDAFRLVSLLVVLDYDPLGMLVCGAPRKCLKSTE